MQTSESIANVAASLVQFQAEVANPEKKGTNPHFKSKYAELDDIITTIRPTLEKHGLAFIQNPANEESGKVGAYTLLLHKSGEFIQFDPVFIPLQKATPHQVGSALTYAKRYSLGAALGLATEEDKDANDVSATPKRQVAREQHKQKVQNKFAQATEPKKPARTEAERKKAGIEAIQKLKAQKGLTEAEFVSILVAEAGEMTLEEVPLSKIVGLHKIFSGYKAGELKEVAKAHMTKPDAATVA